MGNTEFRGRIIRWIDGDTVLVDCRILDCTHHLRVRLARCDAPPIDTPEGLRALSAMQRAAPPGTECVVHAVDRDRYQRIVASVQVGGRDLSDLVARQGGG